MSERPLGTYEEQVSKIVDDVLSQASLPRGAGVNVEEPEEDSESDDGPVVDESK